MQAERQKRVDVEARLNEMWMAERVHRSRGGAQRVLTEVASQLEASGQAPWFRAEGQTSDGLGLEGDELRRYQSGVRSTVKKIAVEETDAIAHRLDELLRDSIREKTTSLQDLLIVNVQERVFKEVNKAVASKADELRAIMEKTKSQSEVALGQIDAKIRSGFEAADKKLTAEMNQQSSKHVEDTKKMLKDMRHRLEMTVASEADDAAKDAVKDALEELNVSKQFREITERLDKLEQEMDTELLHQKDLTLAVDPLKQRMEILESTTAGLEDSAVNQEQLKDFVRQEQFNEALERMATQNSARESAGNLALATEMQQAGDLRKEIASLNDEIEQKLGSLRSQVDEKVSMQVFEEKMVQMATRGDLSEIGDSVEQLRGSVGQLQESVNTAAETAQEATKKAQEAHAEAHGASSMAAALTQEVSKRPLVAVQTPVKHVLQQGGLRETGGPSAGTEIIASIPSGTEQRTAAPISAPLPTTLSTSEAPPPFSSIPDSEEEEQEEEPPPEKEEEEEEVVLFKDPFAAPAKTSKERRLGAAAAKAKAAPEPEPEPELEPVLTGSSDVLDLTGLPSSSVAAAGPLVSSPPLSAGTPPPRDAQLLPAAAAAPSSSIQVGEPPAELTAHLTDPSAQKKAIARVRRFWGRESRTR